MMLLNAALFLGLCGYFTLAGIRKLENLDGDKLTLGFVYGLALAVVWTSFGVMGALFLAKALVGFSGDFRTLELLVRYHDHLRELKELPEEMSGEQCGPADGRPPSRSGPERAPGAVGP